jgi:predicted DNA-binding ribbon-helix-helix protein
MSAFIRWTPAHYAYRRVAHPNVVLSDVRVGTLTFSPSRGQVTRRTTLVYTGATMPMAKRSRTKSSRAKHVRRSVTLPSKIARQVESLARQRDLSDNRVLVELIEQGIEAQQQKEKAFFQLAERFRAADDPEQVKQLGDQLGRFVFGE